MHRHDQVRREGPKPAHEALEDHRGRQFFHWVVGGAVGHLEEPVIDGFRVLGDRAVHLGRADTGLADECKAVNHLVFHILMLVELFADRLADALMAVSGEVGTEDHDPSHKRSPPMRCI